MRKFVFALTCIAFVTIVDPAGAQGYLALPNAANVIPGTTVLPGNRWRDDWQGAAQRQI